MKKITMSRTFVLCLALVNIVPIAAYILSLMKLKKNNARSLLIIICIFDFFLALKVPPYQDLYRRYTETYFSYYPGTSILDALKGKVDILFYINSLFFYKLKIPFFLIPAIYSSLSVYNVYSAYLKVCENRKSELLESPKRFLLSSLVVISFVNIVGIASTLRFGLASALVINSIVEFYYGKKIKSLILAIVSVLMHSSMVIPVATLFLSLFAKLNRITAIILSLVSMAVSGVIIKYLLIKFNPFGLGTYFLVGYVDSVWATFSTNASTLFFIAIQYTVISFFIISTVRSSSEISKIRNYNNIFMVVCFTLSISVTAFNRYFTGVLLYLVMFEYFTSFAYIKRSSLVRMALIGLALYNFVFINIYVQRRPIMLAKMYSAIYTPPMMDFFYTMEDFNNYLKKINSKGDWIGHELGK